MKAKKMMVAHDTDISSTPGKLSERFADVPDLLPPDVGSRLKGRTQGQIIRKRFRHHTVAVNALILFALVVVLCFSAIGYGPLPGWWEYQYSEISPIINEARPTFSLFPFSLGEHPFGQDNLGRDVFALTMRGAQQSLIVMVIIGCVSAVIGITVGAIAGYFGGIAETFLMRVTDVIIVVPMIVLAAVVGKMTGTFVSGSAATLTLGIFLGFVLWTGLARLVRGEFLSWREREFVNAARLAGAGNGRIIFKHILPNVVGVIIVNTTLLMSQAILVETSLSYLGLGVKAPDVSLGSIISINQEAFTTRPWVFWWPGIFIVAICLCINFIGDGLRDAFDPRQKI